MHISEGVLGGGVLAVGAVLATGGVGIGLRSMRLEDAPKAAMVSAAFFVASLIHVPFGPANVHLVLNGLAGVLLGWAVFPALAVALFLQAVLFQFGGLTVLGVNTLTMALPGVIAHYLFRLARGPTRRPGTAFWLAVALGALTVLLSGLLLAASLALGGRAFLGVAAGLLVANLPVMIADGFASGAAVVFVLQVRPDLLAPGRREARL